jgi:hypothetical protein
VTAVRFLLDEHVYGAVALGLRRRSIDVQTVHEAGRRGLSDESHVQWAQEHRCVIVTGDDDYLRIGSTTRHAGIAYYVRDKTTIGSLIRALVDIAESDTLETIDNEVRFL